MTHAVHLCVVQAFSSWRPNSNEPRLQETEGEGYASLSLNRRINLFNRKAAGTIPVH